MHSYKNSGQSERKTLLLHFRKLTKYENTEGISRRKEKMQTARNIIGTAKATYKDQNTLKENKHSCQILY